MEWLREHPYALMAAAGGLVLVILALVVRARITPAPTTGIASTVSATELLNPGVYQPQTPPIAQSPAVASAPAQVPQTSTLFPPAATASEQVSAPASASEIPAAGQTQQPNSPQSSTSDLDSLLSWIYSFAPTTTFSSVQGPVQTPDQQALYTYGNAAGQIVENFNDAHADMAQTLQNWINARSNSADEAAVQQIGTDMETTGASLAALSGVPATAVSFNQALAQGYENAGAELKTVVQAGTGSDASFASSMETYDADADDFTKDYIALVDLFSSYGVQFSQSDPGSVFSFSGSSGL